jgi:hypothetical protein
VELHHLFRKITWGYSRAIMDMYFVYLIAATVCSNKPNRAILIA